MPAIPSHAIHTPAFSKTTSKLCTRKAHLGGVNGMAYLEAAPSPPAGLAPNSFPTTSTPGLQSHWEGLAVTGKDCWGWGGRGQEQEEGMERCAGQRARAQRSAAIRASHVLG